MKSVSYLPFSLLYVRGNTLNIGELTIPPAAFMTSHNSNAGQRDEKRYSLISSIISWF